LRNVICLKWESSGDMGMFNGNEEQSPIGVLIQRCGNNVGHPGCHKQLPVTTMTGDGWESTHRNCDDSGMIYSWFLPQQYVSDEFSILPTNHG
jgi:hypothetical protein